MRSLAQIFANMVGELWSMAAWVCGANQASPVAVADVRLGVRSRRDLCYCSWRASVGAVQVCGATRALFVVMADVRAGPPGGAVSPGSLLLRLLGFGGASRVYGPTQVMVVGGPSVGCAV